MHLTEIRLFIFIFSRTRTTLGIFYTESALYRYKGLSHADYKFNDANKASESFFFFNSRAAGDRAYKLSAARRDV